MDKCPKCGSRKVSESEKEIHSGWRLGLPAPLVVERSWGTKETYKEYACGDCGNKFRFLPSSGETSEIRESDVQWEMLGKKVKLSPPTGQTTETKIDGIWATVKVNVGKAEVIVDDQLTVTVTPEKNVGGLMLVFDESDLPVGVLWAGGNDSQGNFHGIVTPIKLWKTGKTA